MTDRDDYLLPMTREMFALARILRSGEMPENPIKMRTLAAGAVLIAVEECYRQTGSCRLRDVVAFVQERLGEDIGPELGRLVELEEEWGAEVLEHAPGKP
jgi:hypothetical protein